jgi:hypothetical protein
MDACIFMVAKQNGGKGVERDGEFRYVRCVKFIDI